MDVVQHLPNDTNSVELSDYDGHKHKMDGKDVEAQIGDALAAEQAQGEEHNSVFQVVPSVEHHNEEHSDEKKLGQRHVGCTDGDEDLELPEHIDNDDDFSKLLELNTKQEEDLFKAHEILEQTIGGDTGEVEIHGDNAVVHESETGDENDENDGDDQDNREGHDGNDSREQRFQAVSHSDRFTKTDSNESMAVRDTTTSPRMTASDTDDMRTSSVAALVSGNEVSGQLATKTQHFKNEDEHSPAAILQEKGDLLYRKRHDSLTPVMFQQHEILMSQLQNQSSTDNSGPNAEQMLQENNVPFLDEQSTISAYARLDFQSFTFYVQTLHVIIGRRSENDFSHKVDVNLGPSKSISRRHAQIFYNFGTGRFELSIIGKNGAFVDDIFVERGNTVPLKNKTKIQIGQIPFQFVLPDQEKGEPLQKSPEPPLSAGPKELDSKVKAEVELEKLPEEINTETPLTDDNPPDIGADIVNAISPDVIPPPPAPKKPPVKREKEKRQPKVPKKVYSLEEIPLEYRTKPTCSYSSLLTTCIRKYSSPKGMSLSEIYAGIRELFPYYKYCPDGWQSSVRHNLSLNKSFRKVSKEGKGWLWGLDENYIAERERQKKKQAEAAAAKAAAAQERLEQQQLQRAKKAAAASASSGSGSKHGYDSKSTGRQQSISQTLAANRAADKKSNMNDHQRTMKYLQEQLVVLTKNRKGLSNQVIANILTQALAMTINQVTQAAKSKGISGNPLTALMDKNPQHLNLILAAAVNAATSKVTNGKVKQLVNMQPPTEVSSTLARPQGSSYPSGKQRLSSSASTNSNVNTKNGSSSFDPTSLSKFFQPRQPARVSQPSASKSTLPQKRPRERDEEETSSSEESSQSGGDEGEDGNTDEDQDESGSSSGDESSGDENSGDEASSDGASGGEKNGSEDSSSDDESESNDANESSKALDDDN